MKFIKWLAGFIIGCSVIFLLEVLFFLLLEQVFSRHFIPRGFGWLFLPVATGLALANLAKDSDLANLKGMLPSWSKNIPPAFREKVRFLMGGILAWEILLGFYMVIFDPFGGYWDDREKMQLLKMIILPPIAAFLLYCLYIWMNKETRKSLE